MKTMSTLNSAPQQKDIVSINKLKSEIHPRIKLLGQVCRTR